VVWRCFVLFCFVFFLCSYSPPWEYR
jgi:hypothetical protein